MVAKKLVMGMVILLGGLIGIGTIFYTVSVWAASIDCAGSSGANVCFGTSGADTMIGDDGSNGINAKEGNDIIYGKGGEDSIHGSEGDDVISGGDGADPDLQGGTGADRISGGDGNDKMYHLVFESLTFDGKKDVIDCGAGNDEVWINTSVDHDVAVNCETIHAG